MATLLCSIRIYWYHYIGNLVLIPIMANRIYWYQYIGNLVLLLWHWYWYHYISIWSLR